MKNVAFPFLTLPDSLVHTTPWAMLSADGSAEGLGEYLVGWDYLRNLRLQQTVWLGEGASGETIGFEGDDFALEVVVRLGTGGGTLPRRLSTVARRPLGVTLPVLIDVDVDGSTLSQRLYLETTIVTTADRASSSRLAPARAGSRLWRSVLDVALEGEAPRFPMEVVSFRERFAGRLEVGAFWYLHWLPGQLHRDFGGSVRLFLNHDAPEFVERFINADPQTLQVTLADIITQILGHAVQQDDLEESLEDADPTSVAGHIATWLRLAFPGHDLAGVRSLLEMSPGRFHAAILSMADPSVIGGDE